MSTLILSEFDPFGFITTKPNAQFFFERIQLVIQEKTGPCIMFFNICVTSHRWVEQKINDWNMLQLENTVILHKYDEKSIKQHVINILEMCKAETPEATWNKLNFYLENNETSDDEIKEIVWDD